MGLKNKYTSPKVELLDKLKIGNETRVLKVELIETSKVKNHYIYECQYVEKKNIHQTYIIAIDIEDAMNRLSEMVKIPSARTRHFILGNETLYINENKSDS
jgi:hypothetical protein